MVLKPTRRVAAALSSALFGLALLAGCSSDNVSCGVDQCTVTIDRETNASASVLGVEAKFVSADSNTVTLDVAGGEGHAHQGAAGGAGRGPAGVTRQRHQGHRQFPGVT
jgi:hypothetical protein